MRGRPPTDAVSPATVINEIEIVKKVYNKEQ